jgi:hypothetical protein
VVTELDHRCVLEHPARVDDQLSVFQRINIALDQQQVRARFHWKEPAARNIHSVSALEVLDRRSRRRLELYDCLPVVCLLGIDDDFQIHALSVHDPLESAQVDPDVVGVENLEFADGFEILHMLRGHLGHFE